MTPSEDHRLIQLAEGQPVTHIYGLVDPTTNILRYVGKSDYPKKRLWTHLGPENQNKETLDKSLDYSARALTIELKTHRRIQHIGSECFVLPFYSKFTV